MKTDFIQVGNRILDYEDYREEFKLLSNHIKSQFADIILAHGLGQGCEHTKDYNFHELSYYNEELDLQVNLKILKTNPEKFI